MDALFNGLSIADFHSDAHRNIVSLRESQDLFDDLTDSKAGWQAAIDIEEATKAHTYRSGQPIIDRPFEEAAYDEAIDYPFRNWSKTRYSDGSYGVWYGAHGAHALETTIHETVHHWRYKLLQDANWHDLDGVVHERKVYLVRCDAALLDFRPHVQTFPALIDPNSYHFSHQIGARIHHDGHPGLVSRSARCAGDIFAIFNSQVLSQPRPLCFLTYRLQAGSVIVERQRGEVWLRI